jgi:hypothetical protein
MRNDGNRRRADDVSTMPSTRMRPEFVLTALVVLALQVTLAHSVGAQNKPSPSRAGRAGEKARPAVAAAAGVGAARPTVSPQDSLRALQAFLADHGRAAYATGSAITRFTTSVVEIRPCVVTLAVHLDSPVSTDDDTVEVALARVTPTPRVAVLDDASDAWSVLVETSSGADELVSRRRVVWTRDKSTSASTRPANGAGVVLQSRANADRAARLLGTAAAGCGGMAMDPAVAAARNAPHDVSGNALTDSSVIRVKAQCRALVRERLRSPTTAAFTSDSTTIALWSKDGATMMVTGHVTAQNGFGAPLEKSYGCTFGRENEAWLPRGEALLY